MLAAGTHVITTDIGEGETLYQRLKFTQPRGKIKVLDDAHLFFWDGRLFLAMERLCPCWQGLIPRGSVLHSQTKAREVLLRADARCKTKKLQSQTPQA